MKSRLLSRSCAALLSFATAAALGLVVAYPASATDTRPPFYEPPSQLPAHNGDVIRSEPTEYFLDPAKLIKVDANVNRVMYRSSDRNGKPIAVTGTIITPKTPWQGNGERPIVGYAAGTQGLGDQCAPSRQLPAGTEYEATFISGFIQRGIAVAMTDYQGLGTPGLHTYVNRAVEGNAVIDSIRAAQRLPEAQLPPHGPVAVTGYSQGGGAAAAADEFVHDYAPELDVKGVAAGAVPADLAKIGAHLDGSPYAAFLKYSIAGLAAGYDVDTTPYLNEKGREEFRHIEDNCTIQAVAADAFKQSKDYTANGQPISSYYGQEPFKSILAEQRIGNRAPQVPTLVIHSALDDVVPYEVGQALVKDWCAKGGNVQFSTNPGPGHVGGIIAGYPEVFSWLQDRFEGKATTPNCQ